MFDSNLTFENHINNICRAATQNLNVLARVDPYKNMQKRRIFMKYLVMSQFEQCPLLWMFHSRRLNNKTNSFYERALRITYQDLITTFQELLHKDTSVSIHNRYLQLLAPEMYEFYRSLSLDIPR